MKKIILMLAFLNTLVLFGQNWTFGTLNNGNTGSLFGTTGNFPINIFTNNTNIARFSSAGLPCSGLNGTGQGLRIRNFSAGATPGLGEIDMFTTGSPGNGTEIRFGGSGNIAGRLNRFEMHGNYNGLYFNGSGSGGIGVIKFARGGSLYGGLTQTNKWLFGAMSDNPLSMLLQNSKVQPKEHSANLLFFLT